MTNSTNDFQYSIFMGVINRPAGSPFPFVLPMVHCTSLRSGRLQEQQENREDTIRKRKTKRRVGKGQAKTEEREQEEEEKELEMEKGRSNRKRKMEDKVGKTRAPIKDLL